MINLNGNLSEDGLLNLQELFPWNLWITVVWMCWIQPISQTYTEKL